MTSPQTDIALFSRPEVFSAELQNAISEIVPSADALDNPNFNPVDYINNMFPNEQSLVNIDVEMSRIKSKVQRIDEDIIKEVRNQSRSGNKGKQDLESAKRAIQELFGKIHEIKGKAEQSERMVMEICQDIKQLDQAKKHLTTSIRDLKRLHMMVTGVEQLKAMVVKRQYREVGNLLEAVNQLLDGFNEYRTIPKIRSLTEVVLNIKADLNKQIFDDFSAYENQTGPGAPPISLSDVCFVVGALGTDAKDRFVQWFVDGQLQSYKSTFKPGEDLAHLDRIDSRYTWLKKELRFFDETYGNGFPPAWRMPELISEEFCITTRLALSAILESTKSTLEIGVLMKAIQKTLDFEKDLCARFQPAGTVPEAEEVVEDNEKENPFAESGQEEGEEDSYSPGAVRRKWKKHLEEKNKARQQKQQQQVPVARRHTVHKFKGMISSCFDPYMDMYIEQEDKNIRALLDDLMRDETWTVTEGSNPVLGSSTNLVVYFNNARKQCTKLTRGQPLFDLLGYFKKYFGVYAGLLSAKIGEPRPMNEAEQKMVCLIVNTAEYCSQMIEQLAAIMVETIDAKFKEKIDLSQEQNEYGNIVARGLTTLVQAIDLNIESWHTAMTKLNWGGMEDVVEESSYTNGMASSIAGCMIINQKWLRDSSYAFLRDQFAGQFVARLIQSIYKCKRISEVGAQHLLLDIATLKKALVDIPANNATGTHPASYLKLVNREFLKVEALGKVFLTPAMPADNHANFIETYRAAVPDGSDTDFQKILDIKGLKSKEKEDLVAKYLAVTNKKSQSVSKSAAILDASKKFLKINN